jgi:acyl-CoA dehydrogenase
MAVAAVEQAERILDARWSERDQRAAAAAGWAPELWDALVDAGLPWLGVPESSGGAGGSVVDAAGLLRLVGRRAVPVPVAEAGLAGWLLASAGVDVPRAHVAVGGWHPRDEVRLGRAGGGWSLDARLHRVAWAAEAARLVVLAWAEGAWRVALVRVSSASITQGRNLAGERRDAISASGAAVDAIAEAPSGVDMETLWLRGAFMRAVLLAGAMERIAEQTIDYANGREQFGRPISRFQAVQQHLVRLSSEAALAGMAADVAAEALERDPRAAEFEVGVAKAVASRAAGVVGGLAHQVHGAIGMTEESTLHHLTRRLWTWRQEFGSARWWNRRIGQGLAEGGADRLWSRLAE